MGLFDKKKRTYAFADILKGLQNAVNSAHEMLQVQQVDKLAKFWTSNGGEPLSKTIKVGEREIKVPLISLVPHSHLEMDNVEIKFKAKIGEMVNHSIPNSLENNNVMTHADLQMEMDGVRTTDDVMEVTIRFKAKDIPEGVARLTDEYNKLI